MAVPTLDATVGGASANSYATVAESITYHEAHVYGTDWLNADTDQQTIALIMATRLLDAQIEWTGTPAEWTVQALRWPRVGMYDRDWHAIESDVLPQALKDATSEYARHLLKEDLTADSDVEKQGLLGLKAGSIELRFKGSVSTKPMPDSVWTLLVPSWGTKQHIGTGTVTLTRG